MAAKGARSNQAFGAILSDLRSKAGLSVIDLAAMVGVRRQTIYKLENGEREPTWETVQSIARALDVSTEALRTSPP